MSRDSDPEVHAQPGVDLVFIWHHHQPDYRHPRDGRALLPWVRLHATKDYLDMALHLQRHPGIKSTFNFAPSLLEQLDDALAGKSDALFDLLAMEPARLNADQRAELQRRARMAPPWARQRWPRYADLCEQLRGPAVADDAALLRLCVYFLLAWTDPLLLEDPPALAAIAAAEESRATLADRAAMLAWHRELWARVLPAYRALADSGQIELTCSPAFHPILPLLIDVTHAKRARPDLPVASEEFIAPEDARWQIERGRARHAQAFGVPPQGMWPSEGSVSPEAAEILASAGVRWVGTDEEVLWRSLPGRGRGKHELYQPWVLPTSGGELAFFFRDHEISDLIGFVYSRWAPQDAAADLVSRLRRIAADHGGSLVRPVVSVILDGENCWEHYADDGRPFLEALYSALEAAHDIRTVTPAQLLAEGRGSGRLEHLHSGSWIDGDFHIWSGHAEKNRAWDLLARARKALVQSGATRVTHSGAWDALGAAEGSDWFWWFGDDNFTADKLLFDSLFRAHLQAVYERAELPVPGALALPIVAPGRGQAPHVAPAEMVRPTVDGRLSHFYEWAGAGRWSLLGGGSMHRVSEPLVETLHYGFDESTFHLRLDFLQGVAPGEAVSLGIESLLGTPMVLRIAHLAAGADLAVTVANGESAPGARAALAEILEVSIPFAALGVTAGEKLEMLFHLQRGSERLESLPPGQPLRLVVPGPDWAATNWSA